MKPETTPEWYEPFLSEGHRGSVTATLYPDRARRRVGLRRCDDCGRICLMWWDVPAWLAEVKRWMLAPYRICGACLNQPGAVCWEEARHA